MGHLVCPEEDAEGIIPGPQMEETGGGKQKESRKTYYDIH